MGAVGSPLLIVPQGSKIGKERWQLTRVEKKTRRWPLVALEVGRGGDGDDHDSAGREECADTCEQSPIEIVNAHDHVPRALWQGLADEVDLQGLDGERFRLCSKSHGVERDVRHIDERDITSDLRQRQTGVAESTCHVEDSTSFADFAELERDELVRFDLARQAGLSISGVPPFGVGREHVIVCRTMSENEQDDWVARMKAKAAALARQAAGEDPSGRDPEDDAD